MKRVYFAIVIIILTVAISVFSLLDMKHSLTAISAETQALRQVAEALPTEELTRRCKALMEEWEQMEKRFLLYVRHDHLDSIMEHLAELAAFSENEEYSELLSNLDAAIRMMEHLWESVNPSYRTLL